MNTYFLLKNSNNILITRLELACHLWWNLNQLNVVSIQIRLNTWSHMACMTIKQNDSYSSVVVLTLQLVKERKEKCNICKKLVSF